MQKTDATGIAAEAKKIQRARLVVVLGMHRSGTSVVTRALQVMNVDLGTDLLPPQGDNPMGFWEDIDVYSLNVDMLAALGSDWHHLAMIQEIDTEVLREKGYFIRAVELIQSKLRDREVFGLKDPRLARLIPFWNSVFEHCRLDVAYVIAYRNPRSVVRSLEVRNAFPPEKSYALWLAHVIASLHWTETSARAFVNYDQLLDNPREQLGRVSNSLGLSIDESKFLDFERQYLQPGMRHFDDDLSGAEEDRACFPLAMEIYEELLAITNEQAADDRGFKDRVLQWHREFERQRPFLKLSDHFTVAADATRQQLDQCTTDLENAGQELVDSRHQLARLERGLLQQIEAAKARDEQLQSLSERLRSVTAELAALQRSMAEKDGEIARQRTESELLLHKVAWADSELSRLKPALAASVAKAEAADRDLQAVLESSSWQLTAPVRVLVVGMRRLASVFRRR